MNQSSLLQKALEQDLVAPYTFVCMRNSMLGL